MRVSTRLPCQWQLFTEQPSQQALLTAFSLPSHILAQSEWDELCRQIEQAMSAVRDSHTRHVLSLLDDKLNQLAMPSTDVFTPPLMSVVLSMQGLDFETERYAQPGSWLGVHMLLDQGFSFVEAGQITRCEPVQAQDAEAGHLPGYTLGVAFVDMAQGNARRLARHVMRGRNHAA